MAEFDEEDAPGEDEYPDAADTDSGDDLDAVTEPCPTCGMPVYDDAEECPHCGNYISAEERLTARPIWIIATTVLCLAIVLLWFLW